MRRVLGSWALVAVLLTTLFGCGVHGSSRQGARSPAASTPGPGPGSQLKDGWTVPPDAHLNGVVFPEQQRGWMAAMTVDDHPLAVFQALLAQAGTHGLKPSVECEVDIPKGRSFTRMALADSTPIKEAAQAVICGANATVRGHGFWSAYLHWGTYYDRRFPNFASVVMHVPSRTDDQHPQPVSVSPHVMPPMINWKRPQAAKEGSEFTGGYTGVPLHVASGSTLVAPIADDGVCSTGAFAAVLRATGPEDAAADYLRQFANDRYPPASPSPLPAGGDVTTGSSAGGGFVSLTRITVEGSRWLLITRCDD